LLEVKREAVNAWIRASGEDRHAALRKL